MTKDKGSPDPQGIESLVKEAQAARIKEHIHAILSQLKSRNPKPRREAE
jgi:hypothetical protein